MIRVEFVRTGYSVSWAGGRLVDLCDDDVRAGVPFACRHANCGTCRVEVEVGAVLCEPPDDDELQLTEGVFGDGPTVRLGCQLRASGDGVLRLRVLL